MRSLILYSCAIFLLLLISCKQSAQGTSSDNLQVEFDIKNVPAGTVKFIGNVGDVRFLVDSVNIQAGEAFSLEKDTLIPPGYYIALMPGQKTVQFLLDKDQQMSFTADYNDILGTIEIDGSLENELLWRNLEFEKDIRDKREELKARLQSLNEGSSEYEQVEEQLDAINKSRIEHINEFEEDHPDAFFTQFKIAGQFPALKEPKNPDGSINMEKQTRLFREEYWDNVDFSDERLLRTPVLHNKLQNYIETYLPKHPDSLIKYLDPMIKRSMDNQEIFKFIVNFLAIKYNKSDVMGGEKVFVHIVDNYFTDDLAWWSNPEELKAIRREANLFRPSFIGKKGQNLKAIGPNGNFRELYDLKNPYVIAYFWSFDCEHCQEQTPELARVVRQYGDQLGIYAFSLHPDKEPWLSAIKRYGIEEWVNVYDPEGDAKHYTKYHVDITPEIYVLDPNRTIIGKDLKPSQVPTVIDRDMRERGMK